ncbi:MAG: hypothetical protein IPJ65_24770 [Archangiaceae bacterium]|nr:hypothetical protein [Archangiaceae bacterium]
MKRWQRWLLRLGIALIAVEVLYLVSANALLATDVIPNGIAKATHQVRMKWGRAVTLWPGHFTVTDFSMQLDDDNMVQMDLNVEKSTVDLALLHLARHQVRLENARATGVSYRMNVKVSAREARAHPERLAAFPVVPGYDFPPLQPEQAPPPASPEQIAQLWGVELTDVVSTVKEVWIDEFRYLGGLKVKGSFRLQPLKELQVGPAQASFEGGTLSVGNHLLVPSFEAKARCTIGAASIEGGDASGIVRELTASLHGKTRVEGLEVASFYFDEVKLHGGGPLELDVETVKGKLTSDSRVKLELDDLDVKAMDMRLKGRVTLAAAVTPGNKVAAHSELFGTFTAPPLDGDALSFALNGAGADVVLGSTDLGELPAFERLAARVGEARATDVGPITRPAAKYVPVIGPAVLGKGPLTASASCAMTPDTLTIRLHHSKLGAAELNGAVKKSSTGWNGAAWGHFDQLKLGLKLDHTRFGYVPFVNEQWLAGELKRCDIAPEPEPQRAANP